MSGKTPVEGSVRRSDPWLQMLVERRRWPVRQRNGGCCRNWPSFYWTRTSPPKWKRISSRRWLRATLSWKCWRFSLHFGAWLASEAIAFAST